jgi:WD40 repeat protein
VVAATSSDGGVVVWSLTTFAVIATEPLHAIKACFINKDDELLLYCNDNKLRRVAVHNLKELGEVLPGSIHFHVAELCVSPDRRFVALCGLKQRQTVAVIDTQNDNSVYFTDSFGVFAIGASLVFSPNGRLLAACSVSADAGLTELRVYDLQTLKEAARVPVNANMVSSLCFSPDGERIALVGGDGCIFIFSLDAMKNLKKSEAKPKRVQYAHSSEVRRCRYGKMLRANFLLLELLTPPCSSFSRSSPSSTRPTRRSSSPVRATWARSQGWTPAPAPLCGMHPLPLTLGRTH